MATVKQTNKNPKTKTGVGKDVEKLKLLRIVWQECKMVQLLWRNNIAVPQIKNQIAIWFNNSASEYIPKELKAGSQEILYTHVHSNIIHNS